MANVEFDNDSKITSTEKVLYGTFQSGKRAPSLVEFLIKKGICKGEKQANATLLGFVVLCVIASVVVLNYKIDPTSNIKKADVINQTAPTYLHTPYEK